MVDCFIESYESGLRLPSGVVDMLQFWQGKVSMGVVSNFHVSSFPEQLLEKFNLRSYFDFVIDSAKCGYRKPGKEIYAIAARSAQLSSSDYSKVLFIGDHIQNDVIKPIELGMKAIHFDRSLERKNSKPTPMGISSIQSWEQFRDLP